MQEENPSLKYQAGAQTAKNVRLDARICQLVQRVIP